VVRTLVRPFWRKFPTKCSPVRQKTSSGESVNMSVCRKQTHYFEHCRFFVDDLQSSYRGGAVWKTLGSVRAFVFVFQRADPCELIWNERLIYLCIMSLGQMVSSYVGTSNRNNFNRMAKQLGSLSYGATASDLRICTFNCRSLKNSIIDIKNLCDTHDIVLLQEHWYTFWNQ